MKQHNGQFSVLHYTFTKVRLWLLKSGKGGLWRNWNNILLSTCSSPFVQCTNHMERLNQLIIQRVCFVLALVALPYDFPQPSYNSTNLTGSFQNDLPPSLWRLSVSMKVLPLLSNSVSIKTPICAAGNSKTTKSRRSHNRKSFQGFHVTITIAIGLLFRTQMLWQFVCKELRYFLYNVHELYKKKQSKEPRCSLYSIHIYVQR